jgi:hypothetical protein
VELGGGLLLVSGFWTRTAATALALFCLVTALTFHSNFANQSQMIHFLKNVDDDRRTPPDGRVWRCGAQHRQPPRQGR